MITGATRRKKQRQRVAEGSILRLCLDAGTPRPKLITAEVVDFHESGLGVSLTVPLQVGAMIQVRGKLSGLAKGLEDGPEARVAWCLERADGSFRAGLDLGGNTEAEAGGGSPGKQAVPDNAPVDCYERLQISQNADPDTIQRVYRMLAQRYHPDNSETGNEEVFKQVLEAYWTLGDPERRAAYDAQSVTVRKLRWRIFDQAKAAVGAEAERRKRRGILSLLYARRMNDPNNPFVTIHEMEDLLGCPRDHLQFGLWYLKERGLLQRSDNGCYQITFEGVDEAESNEIMPAPSLPMITDGS